ncbi:hypothetical protein [Legionella cardiaca]|uniref:Uncharacterized protein n=1 Tax=Legionella cardiaca TaxID=1071983 RepID=A0ABY8AV95_9GAMM|nr:hypothetical protein [Legionella cardiaca]WED43092.1 hypothetical protein PXX05_14515 [Legionella cardiaca]
MALFFRQDFARECEELTKSIRVLQEQLNAKKLELHEKNEMLAKAFETAAKDIDTIVQNYQRSITNATSTGEKKLLLKEYREIISCLEAIAVDPHNKNAHELIRELEKENKYLPTKETLSRVGNALAALFWLGVFTIATVSLVIAAASIAAEPVSGIAFTMVSVGLMGYAYYQMAENMDALFEPKLAYQNQMQIHADDISFLENVHAAYEIPSAVPTM